MGLARDALDLLGEGGERWTKGMWRRFGLDGHSSYCTDGALVWATVRRSGCEPQFANLITEYQETLARLEAAINAREGGFVPVTLWNDRGERTWADVRAVFDVVIAQEDALDGRDLVPTVVGLVEDARHLGVLGAQWVMST